MSQLPDAATLCIGFDLAWWGGSDRHKMSQADVGWSALLGNDGCLSGLQPHRVDLCGADERPPDDWPPGSCRDPYGTRLVNEVVAIVGRKSLGGRVILALDAPLEAAVRDGELPRRKVIPKGEPSGARYRECELDLKRYLHQIDPAWARGVNVQPGAPLFPRIRSIVRSLGDKGFKVGAAGRQMADEALIEVFPSASIAMNGAGTGHAQPTSAEVRRYKTARAVGGTNEAKAMSRVPLQGFQHLLGRTALEVAEAIEQVSCSSLVWKGGRARLGKGFDDPIDGGIALLTAVCCALKKSRWFGNGSDGAILTPQADGKRPWT